MNDNAAPENWQELLTELRKLTALIAPLQAILAQEEAPKLSDRVDQFLADVSRLTHQMERAVSVMEAEGDARAQIATLTDRLDKQSREISLVRKGVGHILTMLGEPLNEAAR